MSFISSNISITNHVEEAALYCYNGRLSGHVQVLKPILEPIEQQIFSRIIGLLISPAALLEIAIHTLLLPVALVYAIGRSIYFQKCDFLLPWQHIQRIRDAVFPVLFGSLFGLIHPYFGTYAAEPTKKHIATGILLSRTDKDQFDSVCSPLTTISEVSTLLSEIPSQLTISKEERELLHQVSFWEGELEKIQSIDFFNLNLTFKISDNIQKSIDTSNLPSIAKEIAKRVSLITYPIFMILDLGVFVFAAVVSLGTLVVKIVGGQSPAYLEKAWSPEVLLYNLVKIPLFIISSTIGLIVSIVHPKTGLLCIKYPMEWMANVPFNLKMLLLRLSLSRMEVGKCILLPAVQTFPDDRQGEHLSLLPSYGSHMRYLLIQKIDANNYQAELIERGSRHGKTALLSKSEMSEIMQRTLALRFKFGSKDVAVLNAFNDKSSIIDLGIQSGVNNCILTNLFAVIEVLYHRRGNNHFEDTCMDLKSKAIKRYYMYAFDFYPFGRTKEVLEEIGRIMHGKI